MMKRPVRRSTVAGEIGLPNDRLILAIDAYQSATDCALKARPYLETESVLRILTVRDVVSREMAAAETAYECEFRRVFELDGSIRRAAPEIVKSVTPKIFAEWRASRQPTAEAWWWALDAAASTQSPLRAIKVIIGWIFVALAMSVIVEDLRRLLAGSSDGLSTAVQAVLVFVLGGTAIHYAQQLVGSAEDANAAAAVAKRRRNFWLAALLVLFAAILEWRRPAAAEWFSTRGAQEKQSERSTALHDYERAASLNPDSLILTLQASTRRYSTTKRPRPNTSPRYERTVCSHRLMTDWAVWRFYGARTTVRPPGSSTQDSTSSLY